MPKCCPFNQGSQNSETPTRATPPRNRSSMLRSAYPPSGRSANLPKCCPFNQGSQNSAAIGLFLKLRMRDVLRTCQNAAPSIRVARTRKRLPGPPPDEIGHLCCARPTPPRDVLRTCQNAAPSIRVARTRKRLPGPPPPTKSVIYAALGLPPRGDPLDFPIPPQGACGRGRC